MAEAKILRIYLNDAPRSRAERGEFNIINKIRNAFEAHDFRVELRKNSNAERLKSATRRGYSLFHMDDPFHPRALTMRKAYFYPFWRIENSAKRWEWSIAKALFDPASVDEKIAKQFCDFWRSKLFKDLPGGNNTQGIVYIPLQGRILEQRSFQFASPVEMIKSVLVHDQVRDIVIGLHPAETYLPEELDTIKALIDTNPRLLLSKARTQDLLVACDYVVTENSSTAMFGFFLKKPAVLFAKIDFNHIAANVGDLGAEMAIRSAPDMNVDYDKYLCWFLRETAINGGSEIVEEQILKAVRRHGWQVGSTV